VVLSEVKKIEGRFLFFVLEEQKPDPHKLLWTRTFMVYVNAKGPAMIGSVT
jgi:hypothetical protein